MQSTENKQERERAIKLLERVKEAELKSGKLPYRISKNLVIVVSKEKRNKKYAVEYLKKNAKFEESLKDQSKRAAVITKEIKSKTKCQ